MWPLSSVRRLGRRRVGAHLHPRILVRERHRSQHAGWLRAAVLGANDGLVSTASLVLGVSAASADRRATLVAAIAGLVAGALSMAAGEYVSVSSQRDAELADLEIERRELATVPEAELEELTNIYRRRGLPAPLAREVATQLMASDALGAHARDELGLDPRQLAQPVQASVTSAVAFALGAALPVVVVALASADLRVALVVLSTLLGLAGLGALSAWVGGASRRVAALRVVIGGSLALAISWMIGELTGAIV